jgi:hypothetical protein
MRSKMPATKLAIEPKKRASERNEMKYAAVYSELYAANQRSCVL